MLGLPLSCWRCILAHCGVAPGAPVPEEVQSLRLVSTEGCRVVGVLIKELKVSAGISRHIKRWAGGWGLCNTHCLSTQHIHELTALGKLII